MRIDLLVAEIGSTTTVVNAFTGIKEDKPRFLGQGMAATSIGEGDVTLGLDRARRQLADRLGQASLEAAEVFATSSAAGGLSMTV
ncbi:MAG: DNA mismatch repair protein MutL, partial [Clostridiaceae bacterium]|nr:DNA mismatch repair protein MutL [Clostridiaceae bacterium]